MDTKEYSSDEILGFCLYCKEPITIYDKYKVLNGDFYHKNCYKLIKEDTDYFDYGNYTE